MATMSRAKARRELIDFANIDEDCDLLYFKELLQAYADAVAKQTRKECVAAAKKAFEEALA